uniref:Zinc finger protein 628 n=1 Tax=Aceria tosichella TaxID=561515 RepID=A0A6G1SPU8_9ACAR
MVDFECDTCGSSFDDRHRLMQHQSIHLELKKDWFKETPVDEVMKIFNRRRGEFLCNTCNLRFEATFDYDKHNHQVHGQRPYCCQFCGNGTRTFRFWRQYLNHLYDHRYIFSCTIDDCDFTVNRRDSLRFHIFRFHLNCQLPQQQTHIRSAGHHNMLLNDSKWPALDVDEERDDQDEQDQDDMEAMNMMGE